MTVLAWWFVFGAVGWLLNLALYFVIKREGLSDPIEAFAGRYSISWRLSFGLTVASSLLLGPGGLGLTVYKIPKVVRLILENRREQLVFGEICNKLDNDCCELVVALASCTHDEALGGRCPTCGAVPINAGWIDPGLVRAAKAIVKEAEDCKIKLVCDEDCHHKETPE